MPKLDEVVGTYVRKVSHPGQFRLIRAIEAVRGSRRWGVRVKDGFNVSLDRTDLVQDHIFRFGEWDAEVCDVLRKCISSGRPFYDIGANIGFMSLLGAVCGARPVIAFEPYTKLFERLTSNIEANGLSEVIFPQQIALGDKSGLARYIRGPQSNCGQGRLDLNENVYTAFDQLESTQVVVETLDGFIARTGTPPPDIMKIDVEGHEFAVLSGSRKLLAQTPPRIIIFEAECAPDLTVGNPGLLSLLTDSGYVVRHLTRNHHESFENFVAVHQR